MPRITPISAERLGKLFEKAGFKFVRQESDHLIYTKPEEILKEIGQMESCELAETEGFEFGKLRQKL